MSAMASPIIEVPPEICLAGLTRFFGAAQPIGRLAACASSLSSDLKDSKGKLRVGSIITGRLGSALEGLERVSLYELEVFRLDLSGDSRDLVSKQELEQSIRQLVQSLSKASALKVLAVRLACFDMSMERLRLGANAWEALIRCLGELSEYGRLRSLELSSINIKNSRVIQDVSMSAKDLQKDEVVPAAPRQLRRAHTSPTEGTGAAAAAASSSPKLSFLDVLASLSSLEELALTHDEIFGNTAQMLPAVFHKMEKLKRVDLTRNHIPKQVMQEVRASMPQKVELSGEDLQTFYFY